MRSRLEAQFAAWLDRNEFHWQYEPQCFADERGQYLPDFLIKGMPAGFGCWCSIGDARGWVDTYVELKPTSANLPAIAKRMQIIWSSRPDAHLLVVAADRVATDGYLPLGIGRHENKSGDQEAPAFCEIRWSAARLSGCKLCGKNMFYNGLDCYVCTRCRHADGDHHLSGLPDDLPFSEYATA